jgi:hypothetical protein
MGVNLVQFDDGSMGIQGADLDTGAFIYANDHYNSASIDRIFFIATRALRVVGVTLRPTVAGTDGGAVTVEIRKVPSGTAITSGTVVHAATGNLKGTANTNQVLALNATPANMRLAPGDALATDFTGTLTSAAGTVAVALIPL